MVILCDICRKDVTPNANVLVDEKTPNHQILDLNGKICLCRDCYCALGEFARSEDFKKVVADYKKN